MLFINIFSFLVFSLGPLFLFAENAENCPQHILFLPQLHKAQEGITWRSNSTKGDIERSQFQIALFLEAHPDVPVFSEKAISVDYTFDVIAGNEPNELRLLYQMTFPKNLPKDFSALDEFQRQRLFEDGGDFVQLKREKVKILHRVLEDEVELFSDHNFQKQASKHFIQTLSSSLSSRINPAPFQHFKCC